jgi:prepilin-type N-terminal cleavage/methylation domain-containing protein
MKQIKTMNAFKKGQSGFTLVELAVALAIMSFVLAAIYGVFSLSSRTYTTQDATTTGQQNLRAAMEIMVMDIRMAGLDPLTSNDFGVELATATKLRFTSDSIDTGTGEFNGVVDNTNFERITYELQGRQLNQILYETTAFATTHPLISNVQNLSFAYLDAGGSDLGSPISVNDLSEIRTVEITMSVEEPAGRDDPVRRTLTKRVNCRNLAFN